MGLTRIDERPKMSASEWELREMKRHHIKRILITVAELLLMAGVLYALIAFCQEVRP